MKTNIKKKLVFFGGLIFVIINFFVIFKSMGTTVKSNIQIQNQPTQWVPFYINDSEIWMDLYQNNIWYDAPMLTTEKDVKFKVGKFYGYEIKVNGQALKSEESINIPLKKLHKIDSSINIEIKDVKNNFTRTHHIRSLPNNFPDLEVMGKGNTDGYYYFGINDYAIKMDSKGNIVFYKKVTDIMDFKPNNINGKLIYSYMERNWHPDNPLLEGVGYVPSKAVIMSDDYKVIDEIPFLIPNKDIAENYPIENHDIIIIEEGHYLVSSYVGKRVSNIPQDIQHSKFGARVVATVIQEIKDHKLVWQWDSTEHPELYAMSSENNDYFNEKITWADYAHFNSMTIDPKDGNLLCSFRHLDGILKIDRKSGKIMWVFGGKGDQFGLNDRQKFSKQHYVRLTKDGTITLFDNGCILPASPYPIIEPDSPLRKLKPQTRVLEFKIDENHKKLEEFKEYSLEKTFSPIMGSAEKIDTKNNVFLIGWGGRETKNSLFSEIDFNNNNVLFEVLRPKNEFKDDTYRVYKFNK